MRTHQTATTTIGATMRDVPRDDFFVDVNGVPTERIQVGGQEVIVHYDDIPEEDVTTVQGIPCTTALRTVIDIAPDCEPGELEGIVSDCLSRGLFSASEAWTRLAKPDMQTRRGAMLLRDVLGR